jgi:hypothetical protein
MEEYMHDSLLKHIEVHHTCQFCKLFYPKYYTTTFMNNNGIWCGQHWTTCLSRHEEACELKQMKKQHKQEKHNALLRQHEHVKKARQVARDKMLAICLAQKENPIATLTDDVLQSVFKHLCVIEQ